MEDKNRNILITEEEIRDRIKTLGVEISDAYRNRKLYVVSLLRGSFIFTADLVRALDIDVKIGFMTTSSYGHSEETQGSVNIVNEISDDLEGYDVLVVDDIIDTGLTMKYVIEYVRSKGAASVRSCSLLDKPSRRKVELVPDFCGFVIEDVFVVGYGLNYGDYYRNVPYVFNWQ
ncbi:MAG TPA: hypoxanthine phosphoribosyltransferase [Clostridiaceae bacterium]|nr:hypoxanthine phosphoribosyltransferase [Clostridiaceae bacterium]